MACPWMDSKFLCSPFSMSCPSMNWHAIKSLIQSYFIFWSGPRISSFYLFIFVFFGPDHMKIKLTLSFPYNIFCPHPGISFSFLFYVLSDAWMLRTENINKGKVHCVFKVWRRVRFSYISWRLDFSWTHSEWHGVVAFARNFLHYL